MTNVPLFPYGDETVSKIMSRRENDTYSEKNIPDDIMNIHRKIGKFASNSIENMDKRQMSNISYHKKTGKLSNDEIDIILSVYDECIAKNNYVVCDISKEPGLRSPNSRFSYAMYSHRLLRENFLPHVSEEEKDKLTGEQRICLAGVDLMATPKNTFFVMSYSQYEWKSHVTKRFYQRDDDMNQKKNIEIAKASIEYMMLIDAYGIYYNAIDESNAKCHVYCPCKDGLLLGEVYANKKNLWALSSRMDGRIMHVNTIKPQESAGHIVLWKTYYGQGELCENDLYFINEMEKLLEKYKLQSELYAQTQFVRFSSSPLFIKRMNDWFRGNAMSIGEEVCKVMEIRKKRTKEDVEKEVIDLEEQEGEEARLSF